MLMVARLQDRITAVAELHRFILCTRRSGGTAHDGWGCDQSIGSTISDAIVRSWLWSTATRNSTLGYFSRLLQVVYNWPHILWWYILHWEAPDHRRLYGQFRQRRQIQLTSRTPNPLWQCPMSAFVQSVNEPSLSRESILQPSASEAATLPMRPLSAEIRPFNQATNA